MSMMKVQRWIRRTAGLAAVLAATGVLMLPGTARAVETCVTPVTLYNRGACRGFFTNVSDLKNPQDHVNGGISSTNVDNFIATERARLFDTTSSQAYHNNVGIAMVVLVMMGHKGTEFTSQDQGIAMARAIFAQWEQRVRSYAAAGLIDWNVTVTFSNGHPNTAFIPGMKDIAWALLDAENVAVIRFRLPQGSSGVPFTIQRVCNNLVGFDGSFPPVTTPVTPPGTSPPGTSPPGTPPPGTPPPGTPPSGTPPPGTPPPGTPPPTTPPPGSAPYGDINKPEN